MYNEDRLLQNAKKAYYFCRKTLGILISQAFFLYKFTFYLQAVR